ncbi:MAG: thioredoxin family protein [Gammaproteobacteria bacterium]|nr:thioredoxin family protein [Gammaproteobacteria bacterium]
MSLTPSNMLPLGTIAPDFKLPDAQGKIFTRDEILQANGLLVVFMCNHCPYVVLLKEALAALGSKLQSLQIGMAGINANDVTNYPDDAPDKMLQDIKHFNYTFPYLYDESQATAKAYDAACTPDFFLFDQELRLVYRGQFDEARPGNGVPVTGKDLYAAIDALVAGKPINTQQKPSMGCNIKWK